MSRFSRVLNFLHIRRRSASSFPREIIRPLHLLSPLERSQAFLDGYRPYITSAYEEVIRYIIASTHIHLTHEQLYSHLTLSTSPDDVDLCKPIKEALDICNWTKDEFIRLLEMKMMLIDCPMCDGEFQRQSFRDKFLTFGKRLVETSLFCPDELWNHRTALALAMQRSYYLMGVGSLNESILEALIADFREPPTSPRYHSHETCKAQQRRNEID